MKIINREQLKAMLDHNEVFTLVDVLPEDEFNEGHIPGSRSLSYAEGERGFARELEHLLDSRDEKVVVYCGSSTCPRSRQAAQALEEAGFGAVLIYAGGMKDWRTAAYPIESGMHAT
ncbi:MAG: rhodanese-like domain-containing protein [Planctomycetes bacterium]|nr:rhodanese-like domain-containing protein [Planctomycetota bacterium]